MWIWESLPSLNPTLVNNPHSTLFQLHKVVFLLLLLLYLWCSRKLLSIPCQVQAVVNATSKLPHGSLEHSFFRFARSWPWIDEIQWGTSKWSHCKPKALWSSFWSLSRDVFRYFCRPTSDTDCRRSHRQATIFLPSYDNVLVENLPHRTSNRWDIWGGWEDGTKQRLEIYWSYSSAQGHEGTSPNMLPKLNYWTFRTSQILTQCKPLHFYWPINVWLGIDCLEWRRWRNILPFQWHRPL